MLCSQIMVNISPTLRIFEKVCKNEILRIHLDEEIDILDGYDEVMNPTFGMVKFYCNMDGSVRKFKDYKSGFPHHMVLTYANRLLESEYLEIKEED